MPQELEAGRVSPMEVFEHDESRTDRGEGGDEAPHLGKERGLAGDALEPAVGKRDRRRGQVVPQSIASDEIEPRTVGRRVRQVVAVPGKDEHVASARFPHQVAHQRRLADTRGATDEDKAAPAGNRGGQMLVEAQSLPSSSNEGRPVGKLARPGDHLMLHGPFPVPWGSVCHHTVW
jgi:hypothetical protein